MEGSGRLPAAGVMDAFDRMFDGARAWAALLAAEPCAVLDCADGPLWVRLAASPHGPAGAGGFACGSRLVQLDGAAPLSLLDPGRLLHILGMLDDPACARLGDAMSPEPALELGPALPGRWFPAPVSPSGGASPGQSLVAELRMATDARGPFVPVGARIEGSRAGWFELLRRGGWSCSSAHVSHEVDAQVSIGELRLSFEDARALEVGDLLLPDLHAFDSERACRLRFGAHRVDGLLQSGKDRAGVVCTVSTAALAAPASAPRDPTTLEFDLVVGGVRTGLSDLLGSTAGARFDASVALPHVWLSCRERYVAAAELVRSEAGLMLEVVRVARAL